MDAFHLPPIGFGPGSQPPGDEDEALSYLALPQDMRTFAPHIPEVADPDAVPAAATSSSLDSLGELP